MVRAKERQYREWLFEPKIRKKIRKVENQIKILKGKCIKICHWVFTFVVLGLKGGVMLLKSPYIVLLSLFMYCLFLPCHYLCVCCAWMVTWSREAQPHIEVWPRQEERDCLEFSSASTAASLSHTCWLRGKWSQESRDTFK